MKYTIITILSSIKLCIDPYLTYAYQLLQYFVTSFKIIYGHYNISHKIHSLLYIVEYVRNFGSLDTFRTFKFENFMQKIKNLLRKDDKPLQQSARRIYEITCCHDKESISFINDNNISLKDTLLNGPLL